MQRMRAQQHAKRIQLLSFSIIHVCFLLDFAIIPMKRTMTHANAIKARSDMPAYTAKTQIRKKRTIVSSKLIFIL